METSWKLTIEALGTAACELAGADLGAARPQTMLLALGRELLALAAPAAEEPGARMAARRLLLIAERAVKVSELAAMLDQPGDMQAGPTIALAAALAQTIAAGAQQRALAPLAQLPDEELRANFEQEFAEHARQATELATQLERLSNP